MGQVPGCPVYTAYFLSKGKTFPGPVVRDVTAVGRVAEKANTKYQEKDGRSVKIFEVSGFQADPISEEGRQKNQQELIADQQKAQEAGYTTQGRPDPGFPHVSLSVINHEDYKK